VINLSEEIIKGKNKDYKIYRYIDSDIFNKHIDIRLEYVDQVYEFINNNPIDSIDKSQAPVYGSIKRYIDNLAARGIYVENQDVGYELSNVTTDKFIVGAQEVDMYCFSTNADRDFIDVRNRRSGGNADNGDWKQWTLEKQLEQQVIAMQTELQTKYDEYEAKKKDWAEIVRASKEKELNDLNQRIQEFQQQAQAEMMAHAQAQARGMQLLGALGFIGF
jgi:hypothetical protein